MPADTNTPIYGFLLQGTGNNPNAWGENLNDEVFTIAENAIGGVLTISGLTGGAYTLTQANAVYATIILQGTLSSNLTITVPSTANKWRFINQLLQGGGVGNPQYHVLIKTSGGTAGCIPDRASMLEIVCDGTSVIREDINAVGEVFYHATFAPGRSIECDGTTRSRTGMPELFNVIGTTYGSGDGSTTFTLPDGKTAGKFLRSRTASVAVATAQTSQNLAHTHTITGAPAVSSLTAASNGAHTHSINDPGHSHTITNFVVDSTFVGGATAVTLWRVLTGTPSTSSSFTGISVNSDGAHTHNVTGTLTAGTLATGSSGGSGEARPENISMVMCIRY